MKSRECNNKAEGRQSPTPTFFNKIDKGYKG
jgi:hypothetical protein